MQCPSSESLLYLYVCIQKVSMGKSFSCIFIGKFSTITPATATLDCTCLGHLGQCDTNRNNPTMLCCPRWPRQVRRAMSHVLPILFANVHKNFIDWDMFPYFCCLFSPLYQLMKHVYHQKTFSSIFAPRGWTQALDLGTMRWIFYLCAATANKLKFWIQLFSGEVAQW